MIRLLAVLVLASVVPTAVILMAWWMVYVWLRIVLQAAGLLAEKMRSK